MRYRALRTGLAAGVARKDAGLLPVEGIDVGDLLSGGELDGDQAAAPGCIILPGDDAPERVVFEQLQQAQWPEVPQRIGRSPAESIDALNAAMTLADHHEWIKAAADRLTVGGDILWQAMSASWASNCATPEQLLAVAQPVSDALEGL